MIRALESLKGTLTVASARIFAIGRQSDARLNCRLSDASLVFFLCLFGTASAQTAFNKGFLPDAAIEYNGPDPIYVLQADIPSSAYVLLRPDRKQLESKTKTAKLMRTPAPAIGYLVTPAGGARTLSLSQLRWTVRGSRKYAQFEVIAEGAKSYLFSLASTSPIALDVLIKDTSADVTHGGLHVAASKPLLSAVIEGGTALLELSTSSDTALDGDLHFKSIAYLNFSAQVPLEPSSKRLSDIGRSLSCQPDATCNLSDQKLAAAMSGVMKLVITRADDMVVACTGSLLTSTQRRPASSLPYTHIYTALHCLGDEQSDVQPQSLSAFFFFRSSACHSSSATNTYRQVTFSRYLQRDPAIYPVQHGAPWSDQAILTFTEFPPSGARYLPIWPYSYSEGRAVVVPHHPRGDLLKVATGEVRGVEHTAFLEQDNSFQRFPGPAGNSYLVKYDSGLTESGSSGAPMLVRANLLDGSHDYFVAGNLRGGGAKVCGGENVGSFNRLDTELASFGNLPDLNGSFRAILTANSSQPFGGLTGFVTSSSPNGRSAPHYDQSLDRTYNATLLFPATSTGQQNTITIDYRIVNVPSWVQLSIEELDSTSTGNFSTLSMTCGSGEVLQPTQQCFATLAFHPTGPSSSPGNVDHIAFLVARGDFLESPYVFALRGKVNLPAGSTATAIEYYHSAFDHYFITASTDEIAKLDAGVFAGWTRTNLSFGVYGLNSSGASNVCRFFSTSFAPKSSHFYTPLQTECDAVKQNADWQFEGQVFGLRLPDTAGNCSSGTAPLYRLYNSGLSGAPNHRYTSNAAIRSQMMIQGWIPEGYGAQGVIGCVPL